MSFTDRLSGRVFQELCDEMIHAGRWIVADDETINRVATQQGHALMPGPTGEWECVGPNGSATHGSFLSDALPNEQDVDALRQLGQLLRSEAASWLEWSCVSPLAPGLDDAVRSDPFEDEVESQLHHLEAVCRKPRTHIRLDVQRELVGRARRIARDAPQWLASHTEDWHHRTLAGVQPRRIRAEVREERWDLYENRVAARLVDNLANWLRGRCDEVRRILEGILAPAKKSKKFSDTLEGSRHRADRIYRLWGDAWKSRDEDAHEVAKTTLARLDALLYKVLGLQDSPLYRHVPERAQVPRTLKMTNLLNTDDHYRGVARLWSLLPTRSSLSIHAHYQQQQELHESYDAWCMLLVVRACEQLHLSNDETLESPLGKGCSVRLNSGLCLRWEQEGGICIVRQDATLARFVPFIHSLEGNRTGPALLERVRPLVDAVYDAEHWTVILHPANPDLAPIGPIATVGNPPWPGTTGAIDFIRVSPYFLDCVERVARAIRWATLAPQMLAYPPHVPPPPDEHTKTWLSRHGNGWSLLTLPARSVAADKHIKDCVREAVSQREDLEQRHKAKQSRRQDRLLERFRKAEQDEDNWRKFKRGYFDATACIGELKTCPRCGKDAEFRERDGDCFSARCTSESCKARWELRPSDGRRIPVFLPHPDYVPPTDAGPAQIDEQLGCDVLALPSGAGEDFTPPRTAPTDSRLT